MKIEYRRTPTSVEISTQILSRLSDKVAESMIRSRICPIGIDGGFGWCLDSHSGILLIILPIRRAPEIGDILFRLSLLVPDFQNGLEYRNMMVQDVI